MTEVILYDNLRKKGTNILDLEFYQKENGSIPLEEFLLSLPPKLRAKAFRDIELLRKLGSDLKEPYVKPLKGKDNQGLYELRVRFSNDIARIFYFTHYDSKYILLHGFIKKTMKTPKNEIIKAKNYMEDYKRRS